MKMTTKSIRTSRLVARGHRERGSAFIEFALMAPFVVMAFAMTASIGLSANRTQNVSAVARNVTRLVVQGVDFSNLSAQSRANQQLISKMARGLGMATSTTDFTPNPAGDAVVIISKIVLVDNFQCSSGISGWNGQPNTCPNYGQYVFSYRVIVGNATRWTSKIGDPTIPPDPDGSFSDSAMATNTGIRASAFSSIMTLNPGKEAYLVEVFADNNGYDFFRAQTSIPYVYKRYVT